MAMEGTPVFWVPSDVLPGDCRGATWLLVALTAALYCWRSLRGTEGLPMVVQAVEEWPVVMAIVSRLVCPGLQHPVQRSTDTTGS